MANYLLGLVSGLVIVGAMIKYLQYRDEFDLHHAQHLSDEDQLTLDLPDAARKVS